MSRFCLVAVWSVLAVGCSPVVQTRAKHQFSASFDCPSSTATPTSDGYRVEGCGSTAFYRCTESRQLDPRLSQVQPQPVRDELLFEGFSDSIGHAIRQPGKCALVNEPAHRRPAITALPAATSGAQVARALDEPEPASLRKQTLQIAGGELELSADSQGRPDYLVLTMLATRPVFYEPCTPALVADGAKLTVTALRFQGAQRVQLVVPSSQLRTLESKSRLDASVCGLRFSLDEAQRAQVADFARGR